MQETVYWRGRMSWRANAGYVALAAVFLALALVGRHLLLGAVLLASAGFVMLYAYLRILATEYIITSTYVYARYGIISRDITQAKPETVVAVNVEQGILGRLLNYGVSFFDLLRKIKEKNRLVELLRELEKECDFGRLSEEKCATLRQKYEEELKKLE